MTAPEHLLGGRYEVGELLGYGGMAEVHLGRDHRLGRDVAIKMLRIDLARDQNFQLRFRREAQNVATLNHPGIAAVYDTGETEGAGGEALPYIVMEYVSGRTLKDILLAEGRLQPRRALEIAADICAALEFSHRHGIIHRDVKPGNVMTTGNGQIKVMDFGIARDLASGTSTMTQTSAVIGTAQYLSPEQARGEAVDARSDVYAAGCVLYELMCGQPPFVGDSPVAVAYQHVREDPRPLSALAPEVGPDVDAVVLKALAKNPANRYQSAAEMRADLLRAAAGRAVMATPVMSSAETAMLGRGMEQARVGDPGRRRASTWVLVALAVLGVLAVIALIVGLILANQTQQVEAPGVVGLPEDEAVAAIEDAGLQAEAGEPVPAGDCEHEEGGVETQSPAAGESVDEGGTVTYQLCAPPESFALPNVVGFPRQSAVDQLEDLELVVRVDLVDSSEPPDTVVGMDPAEGTQVVAGNEVVLRVSEGNLVAIPDVVGDEQGNAEGRITQAGFNVVVEAADEAPDEVDDIGRVAGQNPPGGDGEFAERGATITIFVYQDTPFEVEDPEVDGQTVTVTWDNGVHGGVTIDWGDGDPPETYTDASSSASRDYELENGEPREVTITISDADESDRTRTFTVTISGP